MRSELANPGFYEEWRVKPLSGPPATGGPLLFPDKDPERVYPERVYPERSRRAEGSKDRVKVLSALSVVEVSKRD